MKQRGFTLIEMLVTITVLSVLATIAIPSFRRIIQDSAQSSAINQLSGALNYARGEAIKRDAVVCVCASSNFSSCATDWAGGHIVYAQSPGVTNCNTVSAALQISKPSSQASIRVIPTPSSTVIAYGADGALSGTRNKVSFAVCDSRGATMARALEVSPGGRIIAGTKVGYDVAGTTALSCP